MCPIGDESERCSKIVNKYEIFGFFLESNFTKKEMVFEKLSQL